MYSTRYLLLVLTVALLALPPAASTSGRAQVAAPAAANIDGWNIEQVGHLGGGNGRLPAIVQAPYIYTAFGQELAVLDFSDPARPTRLAYIMLPQSIISMAQTDQYLYIILSDDTLSIVDIASPANPHIVGSIDGVPSRSGQILIAENKAYTSYFYCFPHFSCSGGFQIWDISNRQSPIRMFSSNTLALAGLFAVRGSLAYVASYDELRILDISDPAAPHLIGTYQSPGAINTARLIDSYVYIAWHRSESDCYTGGLTIVKISNPSNPQALGSYIAPGPVYNMDVDGSMAYITFTSGCMLGFADSIVAVDMSKPAAPRKRGLLQLSLLSHGQLSVANGYAFIGSWNGWSSINIARPDAMRQEGFYGAPTLAYQVETAGDYAYLLSPDHLHVLNISDPAKPYELAFLDVPDLLSDLDVSGSHAYLLGMSCNLDCHSELHIIDISNPAAPRQVVTYEPPSSAFMVTVAGRYAYVGSRTAFVNGCGAECPNILTLVDITAPAQPRATGVYTSPHAITDVTVAGNYAYVSTAGGLRIVDVSDPSSPREAGVYAPAEVVGAAAVSGSYAYVRRGAGWQVLDISSPAAPRGVAFYSFGDEILSDDIDIDGQYAYISSRLSLHVVDIATPAAPRTVGAYHSLYERVALTVAGGTIFLSQADQGLSILRFAGPPRIAGRVADMHGRPFAGVTIASSHGASAKTDATGTYTFTNLFSGTFQLTPTLSGYAFEPPSRTFALPADTGTQNFTILPGPVATTLRPGVASSLIYTDTQNLPTRLVIPSGSVTETLTLRLTPRLRTAIGGQAFAGHAFDLAVLRAGQAVPGFRFSAPVTVTIRYSDLDVRVVSDKQRLSLRRWTGSAWQDASVACGFAQVAPDVVRKTISVPICEPGQFSLFGPTHQAYLPYASQ